MSIPQHFLAILIALLISGCGAQTTPTSSASGTETPTTTTMSNSTTYQPIFNGTPAGHLVVDFSHCTRYQASFVWNDDNAQLPEGYTIPNDVPVDFAGAEFVTCGQVTMNNVTEALDASFVKIDFTVTPPERAKADGANGWTAEFITGVSPLHDALQARGFPVRYGNVTVTPGPQGFQLEVQDGATPIYSLSFTGVEQTGSLTEERFRDHAFNGTPSWADWTGAFNMPSASYAYQVQDHGGEMGRMTGLSIISGQGNVMPAEYHVEFSS